MKKIFKTIFLTITILIYFYLIYAIKLALTSRTYFSEIFLLSPFILLVIVLCVIIIIISLKKHYLLFIVFLVGNVMTLLIPRDLELHFYYNYKLFEEIVTAAHASSDKSCIPLADKVAEDCHIYHYDQKVNVIFSQSDYWYIYYFEDPTELQRVPFCTHDGSMIKQLKPNWFLCEMDWM